MSTRTDNPDQTRRQIDAFRRAKDKWMQSSDDSPLEHHQRHTFTALDYYDVDPAYRVQARMELDPGEHLIKIQTTTGDWREYDLFGTLHFELDGQPLSLRVFQPIGDKAHKGAKELFVPFRDKTAPKETYGAGRYIDLASQDGEEYTLDFNRAYNPWCAYSPNFSCTVPPRENFLPIEIRAGEKLYPDHE